MAYDFSGVEVFWDNDATLVDSEILAMACAVESVFGPYDERGLTNNVPVSARKRYEVEWAGKQVSQMFAVVESWYASTGSVLTPEEIEQHCADDAERVIEVLKDVKAIDGIPETLAFLQAQGAEQRVVTSSSLLRVVPGLENNGLMQYFVAQSGVGEPRVYSATETLRDDPKYGRVIPKSSQNPQIYHYAQEHSVSGAPQVAIEDSASGVGAAAAAGIPVIALTAATHIAADEKEAHGQKLIDKVSEVLGRPATDKDIIVVHDARDIPNAIGRILDLPVVARIPSPTDDR